MATEIWDGEMGQMSKFLNKSIVLVINTEKNVLANITHPYNIYIYVLFNIILILNINK